MGETFNYLGDVIKILKLDDSLNTSSCRILIACSSCGRLMYPVEHASGYEADIAHCPSAPWNFKGVKYVTLHYIT